VPFLRLSRDRRGYENTYLLHVAQPGERPRVLYWYRTAPGVRVGRPPLDEDAIRTIGDQHPDIEFDWSHILEVGAAEAVEVEPPRRRKSPRARTDSLGETALGSSAVEDTESGDRGAAGAMIEVDVQARTDGEEATPDRRRAHDLLEELAGREIATRLHARFAELSARISALEMDEPTREAWRARAEVLNPDNWVTPDEVLSGVERADALFDDLRRALPSHG
jgi:hypothetical protein